jgi:oxygen-dependent protoporphyrinogen oxidase
MAAARATPARTHPHGRHIVVVGGGIAGLAAAHACVADPRSRALGLRCTLIERDARLGGKLHTERVEGCLLEHGADSFLASKPAAATLCRTLGLADHLIGTTPGRAVYIAHGGRLHRFPEGTGLGVPTRFWPIARSGLLSAAEKTRLLGDLVIPRGTASTDESVGAFIRRRLGDAALTRLAGPILGGIYAGDPDALSLRATFPQLLEWEREHRSLLVAGWVRRQRARAVGRRPGGSPSSHSAGAPAPMFLSLTDGLGALVEALRRALDDHTIVTGRAVRRIRQPGGDARAYVAELDDGTAIDADAVVVATPAYAAAEQLDALAPAVADQMRRIPYVSTATVSLGYRHEDLPHALDGHGFVVAAGEPVSITACTWASSKWPHRAPTGTTLLRCYLGAAGRDAIVGDDEAALAQRATADLRTLMGVDAAPTFVRVVRWMQALPQYVVGHLDRVAAIEQGLERFSTLAVAGAAYRGVGVPDCIAQGAAAASRVLDALAAPAVSV